MRLRLVLLVSSLLTLLGLVAGCSDCAPPSVEFETASINVREWTQSCLRGQNRSDLWSAAYPDLGDDECRFLGHMNSWRPGGIRVISIEDRPSLSCSEDLWVFLERGDDGSRGFLMVNVANANTSREALRIISRSEIDVLLIGVTYGPFCRKPGDDSEREQFENCFWGSLP